MKVSKRKAMKRASCRREEQRMDLVRLAGKNAERKKVLFANGISTLNTILGQYSILESAPIVTPKDRKDLLDGIKTLRKKFAGIVLELQRDCGVANAAEELQKQARVRIKQLKEQFEKQRRA